MFPKSCRKCFERILRNHFDPEGDATPIKAKTVYVLFLNQKLTKNMRKLIEKRTENN